MKKLRNPAFICAVCIALAFITAILPEATMQQYAVLAAASNKVVSHLYSSLDDYSASTDSMLRQSADPPSILILGDGISSFEDSSTGEFIFCDYIAECVGGSLTNLAKSGATTSDVIAVIEDDDNMDEILHADIICISAGGNDLLFPAQSFFETFANENENVIDTFMRVIKECDSTMIITELTRVLRAPRITAAANYPTIAEKLLALNPDAQIVFLTAYNPFEMPQEELKSNGYSDDSQKKYNTLLNYINNNELVLNSAMNKIEGVKIADVSTVFAGNGWLYDRIMEKDLHPTQLGHVLIAATIMEQLDIQAPKSSLMTKAIKNIENDDLLNIPVDDWKIIQKYLDEIITGYPMVTTTAPAPIPVMELDNQNIELIVGQYNYISTNRGDLTFKSEDPNVATVDNKGWIAAVGIGQTRISVTDPESNVAYITVTVNPLPITTYVQPETTSTVTTTSTATTIRQTTRTNHQPPDDNYYLCIGDVTGEPGETVSVPVYIYNDPGTAGYQLSFDIDSKLKLDSIKRGNAYNAIPTVNISAPYPHCICASSNTMQAENGSIVLYLYISIPREAKNGETYKVGFYHEGKQDCVLNIVDINDEKLKCNFYDGSVSVISGSETKSQTTTESKPTTTTPLTTISTDLTTMTNISTTIVPSATIKPAVNIGVTSVTLTNGEQFTISANRTDLTYKSNNPDVAVVSPNGVITAVGTGSAIITVIDSDSNVAQMTVNVISATITSVSSTLTTTTRTTTSVSTTTAMATTKAALKINNSNITLTNGEQFTISANRTDLTYKSNNPDVAVVSPNGVITAVGIGQAKITVIDSDSNVAQISVEVTAVTTAKATTTAKKTTTTVPVTTTTKTITTAAPVKTTTIKAATTTASVTITTIKATTTNVLVTTTTTQATTTTAPLMTTTLTETTPIVTTSAASAPLRGDVTGDGEVSVDDAQITLRAYTNRIAGNDMGLTADQIKAADINGDSEVSVDDAQFILKYYTQKSVAGIDITWDELLGRKPAPLFRLLLSLLSCSKVA